MQHVVVNMLNVIVIFVCMSHYTCTARREVSCFKRADKRTNLSVFNYQSFNDYTLKLMLRSAPSFVGCYCVLTVL